MAHQLGNCSHHHLLPRWSALVYFVHRALSPAQKSIITLVVFPFVFALLALPAPHSVGAQAESSAIIVTPTFQEITLEATTSATLGRVTISNQTTQEQSFEVFAVAIQQMDAQGGVLLSDKPLSGANNPFSADVVIQEPVVVLQPKEQKEVEFQVKNSLSLSPGGHYVSLIIRSTANATVDGKQQVLPAISSFLLIRKLGGEQYNLFLQNIRFPGRQVWLTLPSTTTLTFENQGNIHTTPRGEMTIRDVFGRVVVEGTINEGSQMVLPRSQRDLIVQLRQIRPSLPIMLYATTVTGSSDPGEVTFEQTAYSFFISRTAVFIVFGVLLVLALVLIFIKRRHRRIQEHHD